MEVVPISPDGLMKFTIIKGIDCVYAFTFPYLLLVFFSVLPLFCILLILRSVVYF